MSKHSLILTVDPSELPTAQQKGERVVMGASGRPFVHHYEKNKVAKARRAVQFAISRAIDKNYAVADKNIPILVSVEFVYGFSAKYSKSKYGKFKTTRPDIDNLLKGFFDACTDAGVWSDDSQVQIVKAVKRYIREGEQPHICFEFETVEE